MSNYVITFIASGNDLIDNIAITLTDKVKSLNLDLKLPKNTYTQCSQCCCGLH